jgi:hypothetical protein
MVLLKVVAAATYAAFLMTKISIENRISPKEI